MGKKIAKEVIIILLLILAIILLLSLLFYEYSPAKKILPDKVAYTTPENVSQELEAGENIDTDEVVMTYEINQDDIKNYKRVKDYVPGKKNPFASMEQENITSNNTTASNTNSNNSTTNTNTNINSTNITNETKNNTTGYLPNKGTK